MRKWGHMIKKILALVAFSGLGAAPIGCDFSVPAEKIYILSIWS